MNKMLSVTVLSALLAATAVPALAAGEASPGATPAPAVVGADLRAGALIGAPVTNSAGESIGKVADLVIGPDNRIDSAVLSVGGFLGVGDKLVALKLTEIQILPEKSGHYLVQVAASKDELKAMPEVELN